MKIEKDWKKVLKRYSFIAHLLVAISSVSLLAIVPFVDYVPLWVSASITVVLALLGIIGSFLKQTNQETECECKVNEEGDSDT